MRRTWDDPEKDFLLIIYTAVQEIMDLPVKECMLFSLRKISKNVKQDKPGIKSSDRTV